MSVLIGPNGSGKSSILQSLAIWRGSAGQSEFQTETDAYDYGDPQDLRGPDRTTEARLGFTVRSPAKYPALGLDGVCEISTDAILGGEADFHFNLKTGNLDLEGHYTRPEAVSPTTTVTPEQIKVGRVQTGYIGNR